MPKHSNKAELSLDPELRVEILQAARDARARSAEGGIDARILEQYPGELHSRTQELSELEAASLFDRLVMFHFGWAPVTWPDLLDRTEQLVLTVLRQGGSGVAEVATWISIYVRTTRSVEVKARLWRIIRQTIEDYAKDERTLEVLGICWFENMMPADLPALFAEPISFDAICAMGKHTGYMDNVEEWRKALEGRLPFSKREEFRRRVLG